jgi:hypothetical protein
VNKGGRIGTRRITDQAVLVILAKRAAAAGVPAFSPHDLRRSFISDLLDRGADISTAQSTSPGMPACRLPPATTAAAKPPSAKPPRCCTCPTSGAREGEEVGRP